LEFLNGEPRISKLEVYYGEIKEKLNRLSLLIVKEKATKYPQKKK